MDNSFEEFTKAISKGSADFFRNFVEQMPGGFFVYRAREGEEVLHINNAALKIFGCDTLEEFTELTGNSFRGMVHPEDLDGVERSIADQISANDDKLDFVEYRIKQKNGSTRWITDYGRFLHTDAFGDVFYVFISDDTERMKKRMERLERANKNLLRISARESQYRKAILYDALFFYEVDLTEDRFVTAVKQTGENNIFPVSDMISSLNMSEMRVSEFIKSAAEFASPSDRQKYLDFFDSKRLIKCCDNGELEQVYDKYTPDKLGRRHLLHYAVLLGRNTEDGSTGALIIIKDITEQSDRRRFLNETLQQAQAASVARNAFLSNMSHDIKTPLNAILGFADLIKLHVGERGRTLDYLEKIRFSGNQLLSIVSEALEVARMESGKAALAETEGDLAEMLDEAEKNSRRAMSAKGLRFKLDRSGIVHTRVTADFTRLSEILVQLLDNAVKYTENGGSVSLLAAEEPQTDGYGKYSFTVEDTGCGISEEFMEHLFEPFSRESNTTMSGVLGSGLGMTVVKNLVDLMDGEISVESVPNKGSRVTVSVTLKQLGNVSAPAAAKHGEPISLEGLRVLLVEDNEINSEIAEELLTEEGFIIETASDGDIAVEMVKAAAPDHYGLILMDIQMPRMNGYDTARAIRALGDARADIPIIALSANTYAEDRKRSIESGMDAHAPKPIDLPQLCGLIRTVLGRKNG
ncbi:MAG: ATP-binding protein [Lachnospiraceae bacterium]|nr:ATP-binding protein [Ruminococcus sp.]MCM1274462.1 ATP-binding protein [Lachnospiraceae bacterium]